MANIYVHDGGGGSGPTGYLQMDSGALLSATLNEVSDQSNQFSCLWLSTVDLNNTGASTGANKQTNTAYGSTALITSGLKLRNTAIGYSALRLNGLHNDNTAVGSYALDELAVLSSGNTAVGSEALRHFGGGGEVEHVNTAVGFQALKGVSGASYNNGSNTGLGYQALKFIDQNGEKNTAIGHQSQLGTTGNGAGSENTSVGYLSLNKAQNSAQRNTAIGSEAALNLTTSDDTIAIGHQALKTLSVNGHKSIAIGNGALELFVGNTFNSDRHNIAIGYYALRGVSSGANNGYYNIAIGESTLQNFNSVYESVVIGHNSMVNNTIGSRNTVIGAGAGVSLQSAGSNILIGYGQNAPNTTTETIMIGYRDTATGSNEMRFGSGLSIAGAVTNAAASQTHYWSVFINGTAYKILLST
jgi:hypothetical protein